MSNTALITGASSGIGRAMAHYHASLGGDLIITARREAELMALKDEIETAHNTKVSVFALDLGTADGAANLYQQVQDAGLKVDYLINNAGFGGHGLHIERALEDELSMINLNICSLVRLTHLFAKDMVANGGGKILNVGSTAGYAPGPNQAVYFATKAFVNSYSQAVDHELRKQGVTTTLLAPGFVETEFAKSADLEGTNMVKMGGASAESVAKHGYDAMMKGKLVTINQLGLSVALNWIVPLLPKRAVMAIMAYSQSK